MLTQTIETIFLPSSINSKIEDSFNSPNFKENSDKISRLTKFALMGCTPIVYDFSKLEDRERYMNRCNQNKNLSNQPGYFESRNQVEPNNPSIEKIVGTLILKD